jgi:IS5 family transposase
MIGSLERQSTLFYVAFHREASLIKDDLLERLDKLLEDPVLVELVAQALGARRPHSRSTGRPGIAPDRALRCCVLKHLKDWSFRELERELRGSLVYRRFTRFHEDPIPDYATFSRVFAALGEETTLYIHEAVVGKAKDEKVAPGKKVRTDTTVVEANVHHPTDSSLLADGIRVVTRILGRISEECQAGAVKVVNHARSAQHRVLEINRAAKARTDSARERMQESYRGLVRLATGLVRQAQEVKDELAAKELPIVGSVPRVLGQLLELDHFLPLVGKVIDQTKARVFGGDNHVTGKVLSLFEEHTQVIRKGKAHKPTEFGRLVRLDEVENGIVSHYEVKDGNPADSLDFVPVVSQHQEIFGHPPQMATADRGFYSAQNEREAKALGVKRVVVAARGKLSRLRAEIQKQRWFRQGMRWRAGIEARIGTLENRFGMARAMYKGDRGFKRHVGWSVITNNLVSIARVRERRKERHDATQAKDAA